jgi:hypothetical protein
VRKVTLFSSASDMAYCFLSWNARSVYGNFYTLRSVSLSPGTEIRNDGRDRQILYRGSAISVLGRQAKSSQGSQSSTPGFHLALASLMSELHLVCLQWHQCCLLPYGTCSRGGFALNLKARRVRPPNLLVLHSLSEFPLQLNT